MRLRIPLCLLLALGACGAPEAPAPGPSVLLITVDTLRADHTTPYGYALDTTPNLAALASRGTTFVTCICAQPETGPSIASILTSRYPREIGVRRNGDVLPEEFPTLAEAFSDSGYRTAAFVSTYLLKPHASGLDRGFATYDAEMDSPNFGHENFERRAEGTVERALAWLAETDGRPFFLWVHLYDPHGPYDPGPDLERRFHRDLHSVDLHPSRIVKYQRFGDSLDPDDYVARYDGEIFRVDRAVGRLLDAVGSEAIVALTADHGEGLGEGDYWFRHGSRLDTAALRVPFILAGPGVPVGREEMVVRNIDVSPTLIALAGLDGPLDRSGWSLKPLLSGEDIGGLYLDDAHSEARRLGDIRDATGVDTRYKVSVTHESWRLVLWPESGASRLYNFATDPLEQADLTEEHPGIADNLRHRAARWLLVGDRMPGPGRRTPKDVSDALRGLGYLDGGGGK